MAREEIYGFDEDDADKIVRMARQHARNMGEQVIPEDERTSDRSVAVRLTGPRDPDNANMYPGQIISWKPGLLGTAEPSGSADSTSFEEYDDVWFASKNEDDTVADDCWVIVSARDVGGLPADPTGVVLCGIVVGAHPTTEASIVLHSFRPPANGSSPCNNLPLTFREYLGTSYTTAVVSGTTVLVPPLVQRFRNVTITADGCFELGEPYCVAATTAPCVEGEIPGSPQWWCVDGACMEVYDGITPTGTAVSGPFATKTACVGGCPPPPPPPGTIDTTCCPSDLLPETLNITFAGSFAGMGTVALVYGAGAIPTAWTGSVSGCGGTVTFELSCPGGTSWTLNFYGAVAGLWGGSTTSCNPLLIEGSGEQFSPPCLGPWSFTVTE